MKSLINTIAIVCFTASTVISCTKMEDVQPNQVLAAKNEYRQVNKTISVIEVEKDGKKDSIDIDADGAADLFFQIKGSATNNISKINTAGPTSLSASLTLIPQNPSIVMSRQFGINALVNEQGFFSSEAVLHKNFTVNDSAAVVGIGGRGNTYIGFKIKQRYGWMQVRVSHDNKELVILDYAYSKTDNQPIAAGVH